MKRTAVLLLTAVILLTACGSTPPAEPEVAEEPIITITLPEPEIEEEPEEEPETEEEVFPFDYEYNNRWNGIFITAYISDNPDVIIPQEIDGVPVVGIGREAFKDANISSVIIPEGILLITTSAFENNPDLTEIVLPKSLTGIWDYVFHGCVSLVRIDILNSEFSAGDNDFGGNENMIITFRDRVFTYEDINMFDHVWIKDIEPDPDMVAEWEANGEWDVSELYVVFYDRKMNDSLEEIYEATIVNLDGEIKTTDFNFTTYWEQDTDWNVREKEVFAKYLFEAINDKNFPITAQFDKIPDDIIESARTLEPFVLDVAQEHSTSSIKSGIYIVVGSGENRRIVEIGFRRGTWHFSTDERVNELAERIREWRWEQ